MPHDRPEEAGERPRPGLALASVVISAVGLVLALSTWTGWLLVLPGFREAQPYSWLTMVFMLVLGALWFVVLPLAVVGVICGVLAANRSATGGIGRLGIGVAVVALLVALAGAVVFVLGTTRPLMTVGL